MHSAAVLVERRRRFAPLLARVSYVAAPMVGISDLPFRLLCRRFGASLCYTEMIDAERVQRGGNAGALYARRMVPGHALDRPLVAQFAANNPATLLAAAVAVQERCDAVCLNAGCPQRTARRRGFGAFLLDEDHASRLRLLSIVHTVSGSPELRVPLLVKIRVLDSADATVRLCLQLALAGASLIAVHGRRRGRVDRRRDGAADLSLIRAVKAALVRAALPVLVLSNGNVRDAADVAANLRYTGADGAMVADALSRDPALFSRVRPSAMAECDAAAASPLLLARAYLRCAKDCAALLHWGREEQWLRLVSHVVRMAGAELRRYQVDAALEWPCTPEEMEAAIDATIDRQLRLRSGQWVADPLLTAQLEESGERRQRTMDILRARERMRELQPHVDEEMATLNSKGRYKKRKREERAAQEAQRAGCTVADTRAH